MNKINELKEGVYIKTVLDYLGYPYKKSGVNYFCKCPSPEHNDKHDTNCHFKEDWHKLYCEACGASISSIDLIMYVTGCNFKEALNVLWEINGCPDWFLDKPSDTIILNKRQRELLDWHPNPQIDVPIGMSEFKPKGKYNLSDNYYVITKTINAYNKDFATQKELLDMLYNKCNEKITDLKKLYGMYYDYDDIIEILKNDIKEITSLRTKVKYRLKKELA